MNYDSFRYYFPPRPEIKCPQSSIGTYERMGFWAQPKLNGSCGLIFTTPTSQKLMGRHQDTFARNLIPNEDFARIHRGMGYQVLVGEYLNKSKRNGLNQVFNGCFVVFDILVHNGTYLIGSSFSDRQNLLDSLYTTTHYDDYIDRISNNIYRVKNFTSGFDSLYREMTKVDMYEGLVMKRANGILEAGLRPNNNTGWQIKCRKATKNYTY